MNQVSLQDDKHLLQQQMIRLKNAGCAKVSTNLSCLCDSQTVQCSDSNVDNFFASQSLHHLGLPHMDISAVAQPEVVAFAPVWKHLQSKERLQTDKE